MGLISPAQSADGETIEASDINGPINTIANEVNGNIDTVNLKDAAVSTAKLADSSVTSAKLASGAVVQYVYTQSGAVATGSTVFIYDDTIPQNTEGNQFMTLAITPKATTNILKIEVLAWLSGPAGDMIGALFQDSTANALSAVDDYMDTANGRRMIKITYSMVAGTTAATTFKFRGGSVIAGTVTFNGSGGSRFMGGVAGSTMTITEYKA